jgi:hypothetical protein
MPPAPKTPPAAKPSSGKSFLDELKEKRAETPAEAEKFTKSSAPTPPPSPKVTPPTPPATPPKPPEGGPPVFSPKTPPKPPEGAPPPVFSPKTPTKSPKGNLNQEDIAEGISKLKSVVPSVAQQKEDSDTVALSQALAKMMGENKEAKSAEPTDSNNGSGFDWETEEENKTVVSSSPPPVLSTPVVTGGGAAQPVKLTQAEIAKATEALDKTLEEVEKKKTEFNVDLGAYQKILKGDAPTSHIEVHKLRESAMTVLARLANLQEKLNATLAAEHIKKAAKGEAIRAQLEEDVKQLDRLKLEFQAEFLDKALPLRPLLLKANGSPQDGAILNAFDKDIEDVGTKLKTELSTLKTTSVDPKYDDLLAKIEKQKDSIFRSKAKPAPTGSGMDLLKKQFATMNKGGMGGNPDAESDDSWEDEEDEDDDDDRSLTRSLSGSSDEEREDKK